MAKICSQCRSGTFDYTFSNIRKTFSDAVSHCTEQGGSLAVNLTQNDYGKLKRCCTSSNSFWIGLINDRSTCSNITKRFHWLESTDCLNEMPLHISVYPNHSGCSAVALKFIEEPDLSFHRATAELCSTRQHFICQFSQRQQETLPTNNLTNTRLSNWLSQSVDIDPFKINSSDTLEIANLNNLSKDNAKVFNEHFDKIAQSNAVTSSVSPYPPSAAAAIVGGLLGLVAFALIVLSFYCIYSKKKGSVNLNKIRIRHLFKKKSNKQEEQEFYNSFPFQIATFASAPLQTSCRNSTISYGSTYVAADSHPFYLSINDLEPPAATGVVLDYGQIDPSTYFPDTRIQENEEQRHRNHVEVNAEVEVYYQKGV